MKRQSISSASVSKRVKWMGDKVDYLVDFVIDLLGA